MNAKLGQENEIGRLRPEKQAMQEQTHDIEKLEMQEEANLAAVGAKRSTEKASLKLPKLRECIDGKNGLERLPTQF